MSEEFTGGSTDECVKFQFRWFQLLISYETANPDLWSGVASDILKPSRATCRPCAVNIKSPASD